MGPYSIGLIVVCLMDQAEQTVEDFTKAKILLIFFYMVGICKLEVMGTFIWVRYLIPPKLQSF